MPVFSETEPVFKQMFPPQNIIICCIHVYTKVAHSQVKWNGVRIVCGVIYNSPWSAGLAFFPWLPELPLVNIDY